MSFNSLYIRILNPSVIPLQGIGENNSKIIKKAGERHCQPKSGRDTG